MAKKYYGNKANQKRVLGQLQELYDGIGPALKFNSTYQLLIAVLLSAQTNDNQVNKITESLFIDYDTAEKMSNLTVEEVEEKIKTCGLYKNKAKNLLATSKILVEKYNGEVPADFDKLVALPGVGQKTANVVLSVGFGVPALAVDTHVFRLAHRLGFSMEKTPEKVEIDLCNAIPRKDWAAAHHWFIWHGRKLCKMQNPACDICPLQVNCMYYNAK